MPWIKARVTTATHDCDTLHVHNLRMESSIFRSRSQNLLARPATVHTYANDPRRDWRWNKARADPAPIMRLAGIVWAQTERPRYRARVPRYSGDQAIKRSVFKHVLLEHNVCVRVCVCLYNMYCNLEARFYSHNILAREDYHQINGHQEALIVVDIKCLNNYLHIWYTSITVLRSKSWAD